MYLHSGKFLIKKREDILFEYPLFINSNYITNIFNIHTQQSKCQILFLYYRDLVHPFVQSLSGETAPL